VIGEVGPDWSFCSCLGLLIGSYLDLPSDSVYLVVRVGKCSGNTALVRVNSVLKKLSLGVNNCLEKKQNHELMFLWKKIVTEFVIDDQVE